MWLGATGEHISGNPNEEFNALLLSDGYRLTRLLGNGAFGTVWAAEKSGSQFSAEILRLLQCAAQNRASHAATLHSQLNHPSIVKLYELFLTSRFMVLIMEYISGGALEDHLPRAGQLIEEEPLVGRCRHRRGLKISDGISTLHLPTKRLSTVTTNLPTSSSAREMDTYWPTSDFAG
ncbi:hypothetical protein A4X13_0g7320 [Tilletia indica]|uniref:Uncharacterized protein n=1 Tax=Tilletia indica TaxID=43049 RepID=A0A177T6Q0_9BASI|nr:hypothetical protein A4X13_0g7320 [Tilletia indica]